MCSIHPLWEPTIPFWLKEIQATTGLDMSSIQLDDFATQASLAEYEADKRERIAVKSTEQPEDTGGRKWKPFRKQAAHEE